MEGVRSKLQSHQLIQQTMHIKTWIPLSFWNQFLLSRKNNSPPKVHHCNRHCTILLDSIFGNNWWKKRMMTGPKPDGWFSIKKVHLRFYPESQKFVVEGKWERSPENKGEPN